MATLDNLLVGSGQSEAETQDAAYPACRAFI